jgi:hypothetical protein
VCGCGRDELPDEEALVTPGEPQYVEVGSVNNVTFCALLEDVVPGAPDDISLATPVNVVVQSISGGTVYDQDVTPSNVAGDWIACATFPLPDLDVYEVTFDVYNCDYYGTASTILVVYDPDSGFVTGGGWFEYPGSTDRVNFGLVYRLVGKKGTPRGNLLVTRHLANGDICRAKSNGLGAAAVIDNTASFSGKGNYVCRRPDGSEYDGAGNLNFLGWVEDNGEPGSHAADDADRFWIRVPAPNSQLLMMKPPATHAEDLMGGNIQVPQPSSR